MSEQILKNMYNEVLNKLDLAVRITEEHNMTNSQIFLDFLDTLNKISVSY